MITKNEPTAETSGRSLTPSLRVTVSLVKHE